MGRKHSEEPLMREARILNALLNTLSLFARRTTLEWLPELASEMGITGERFMVMFELELQPDSNLKQLAHSMVVSPSSMSVMVNSMVEQGLVTRVHDPEDRRRVVLRLSEKGREELLKAEDRLVEKYREYLSTLSETDRRELTASGGALLAVVNRILGRQ